MELIEFPEQTLIIAKDQPQYMPMPAHVDPTLSEVPITCCWRLTWRERLAILLTGNIWHTVLTFGGSLQPQLLQVVKPEMLTPIEQLRKLGRET
jgi:hypothetical protein